jgi:hypothetical protein
MKRPENLKPKVFSLNLFFTSILKNYKVTLTKLVNFCVIIFTLSIIKLDFK